MGIYDILDPGFGFEFGFVVLSRQVRRVAVSRSCPCEKESVLEHHTSPRPRHAHHPQTSQQRHLLGRLRLRLRPRKPRDAHRQHAVLHRRAHVAELRAHGRREAPRVRIPQHQRAGAQKRTQ